MDALLQRAELQEAVERMSITGGAERVRLFNNHISVADNTEKETPWSLVIHKS